MDNKKPIIFHKKSESQGLRTRMKEKEHPRYMGVEDKWQIWEGSPEKVTFELGFAGWGRFFFFQREEGGRGQPPPCTLC